MPIPPLSTSALPDVDASRRALADELAETAVDLRDPAAAAAVVELVAAVHALLVRG